MLTLLELINLAAKRNEQMLFHTPHLCRQVPGHADDLDLLRADGRSIAAACVDHCEEHTIRMVPTKRYSRESRCIRRPLATPERTVDMVEEFGSERILVELVGRLGTVRSACGAAIHGRHAAVTTRMLIQRIVHENPLTFLNQSVFHVLLPKLNRD